MILLETRGLEKSFGLIQALRNINLRIIKGEITALLGPSGSGKSTLLKIVAGLENPSSGALIYKDARINDGNRHLLIQKSTMIFQKSIFFNTTVFKNVAFGLSIRGLERHQIEERVYKALQKVRMENFAQRQAKKLSGGEQQRVSIARALAIEPELLLIDEPTANLDIANAMMIEELIKNLNGNSTIVVATHNIHQAKRISSWATFLFDGTIIEQDETERLLANPNDIRTQKFVKGEFYF
ncbi:MAG: phosphate ABC transporter ATP-binding protein [Candidatus Bathyarchaeota archaeon]